MVSRMPTAGSGRGWRIGGAGTPGLGRGRRRRRKRSARRGKQRPGLGDALVVLGLGIGVGDDPAAGPQPDGVAATSKVRIATLSSSPATGLAKPIAPV